MRRYLISTLFVFLAALVGACAGPEPTATPTPTSTPVPTPTPTFTPVPAPTPTPVTPLAFDFEEANAPGWELGPGWSLARAEEKGVLEGRGHKWATLLTFSGDDYTVRSYALFW